MAQLALFELLLILFAVPLSYILATFFKKYNASTYKNEIDHMFHKFWNGKPEYELYAWQMVRKLYFELDTPKKYMKYIDNKIISLNRRDILSQYYLDKKGKIKAVDQSSNKTIFLN